MTGYEQDFVAWADETAQAIREERWSDIDRAALLEEVEGLSSSTRRELSSRISVLLMHMLKRKYQPELVSRSWLNTITSQRYDLALLLEQSPSLRPQIQSMLPRAYRKARLLASNETGIPEKSFPAECDWTVAEILNSDEEHNG